MDEELKQHLVAIEARLAEGAKGMEQRLEAKIDASEERLKEFTRGLQTELLRGFELFSRNQSTRLQKVEVDQRNLDASLSDRVLITENRLHQIEMRLGIDPPEMRR